LKCIKVINKGINNKGVTELLQSCYRAVTELFKRCESDDIEFSKSLGTGENWRMG